MKKPVLRQRLLCLLVVFLFTAMLGVQSASAQYYEMYPSSSSSGGGSGSSAAVVVAIAVGVAFVVSSVDCASEIPSFSMCQPGGSSYRTAGNINTWGSFGSLIRLHDFLVTPIR